MTSFDLLPAIDLRGGRVVRLRQGDFGRETVYDRDPVEVAEEFAARNIGLALETGQETAETLRSFLENLGCPNVGVNFDPANMILYGKGDPIEAMRVLGPWIRQVHVKDAKATLQPGTWGEEVVAGTGEVDWKAFFSTLETLGFQGDCCIEREAGAQRTEDIRSAKSMVESLAG